MTRLIDADELLERSWRWAINSREAVQQMIEGCPTIDAVPVIRCKNCKHWECDDEESYCNELGIFNTDHNSYCSYAKRKEE